MSDETTIHAPLNTKWVIKMVVVIVALLLFGALGFYDATVKYPARGERYASWAQWQYLDAARSANNEDFGVFERDSSITNPVEELDRLNAVDTLARNQRDAGNSTSSRRLRANMQMTSLQWLEALKVVNMLDAEHTSFESPSDTFNELAAKWGTTTSLPKPLKSYDIPMQWVIMFVCIPIGFFVMFKFMRVRGLKYSWDASAMRLGLPSGNSITPADLEEVVKRKWDKFIVFLKIKDGHEKLGGKEVRVDTYQHKFVEDWIIEMEAEAFGPQEDDDDAPSEPPPEPASAPENDDSDD
ncbi:MAG: hypothetical protein JKY96_04315 [Phycisphaerales bacterium]|nr:hypothetical protein [Phycisphaerales bacterium]